jgi:hypothetical protein
MAVLDNLLQLFAQRDMRKAVAGQRSGAEAMQPQAPQAPQGLMSILGPQADPRRAAAVGAGQGLLANTPGTEGLAGAIGGARDAVAEVMAARRQAALEAQAMALRAQQDAARNSVLQKYIGKDDLDSVRGLSFELTGLGDDRSLKMAEHLKPLLESLKIDKDKATVEGDSAYKTALTEFAVEKTGGPADIHALTLTPAEAMRVNARADLIRKMGTSSTNLSLNGPTPEKTLGPAVAGALVEERKAAEAAMRVVGLTDESTRLLQSGIYTGKLAPSIEKIAGVLDGLGMLNASGTNRLSATQEYLSNTAETVLAEVERLGGDLRGLTDREKEWLEKSKGGSIGYTQPALFSIAAKLSRRAHQQVSDYISRARRSTAGLSDEQKAFFEIPGVDEALKPRSKLRGILNGER